MHKNIFNASANGTNVSVSFQEFDAWQEWAIEQSSRLQLRAQQRARKSVRAAGLDLLE